MKEFLCEKFNGTAEEMGQMKESIAALHAKQEQAEERALEQQEALATAFKSFFGGLEQQVAQVADMMIQKSNQQQAEINGLKDALTNAEKTAAAQQSEMSHMEHQLQAANAKVTEKDEHIAQIKSQCTAVMEAGKAELEKAHAEIQSLKEQRDARTAELENLRRQGAEYIQSLEEGHKAALSEAEAEMRRYQEALNDATQQLNAVTEDHDMSREIREQMTQQHEQKVKEVKELHAHIQKMNELIKAMEEKQAKLEEEKDEAVAMVAKQENEIYAIKSAYASQRSTATDYGRSTSAAPTEGEVESGSSSLASSVSGSAAPKKKLSLEEARRQRKALHGTGGLPQEAEQLQSLLRTNSNTSNS